MINLRLVKDGDNQHRAVCERLRGDTGLDFEYIIVEDDDAGGWGKVVRLMLKDPSGEEDKDDPLGLYWYTEYPFDEFNEEGVYWDIMQNLAFPLEDALQDILEKVGYVHGEKKDQDKRKLIWVLCGVIVVLLVAVVTLTILWLA